MKKVYQVSEETIEMIEELSPKAAKILRDHNYIWFGQWQIGQRVQANQLIVEGSVAAAAVDFPEPGFVHAVPCDYGTVVSVDDGAATVRFDRTGTATIVGNHEIDDLGHFIWEYLEGEGVECEDLDEMVHETFSQAASNTNNTSLRRQILMLMRMGVRTTEILQVLEVGTDPAGRENEGR